MARFCQYDGRPNRQKLNTGTQFSKAVAVIEIVSGGSQVLGSQLYFHSSQLRDSAVERTQEFSDERVTYYWDEHGITGTAWQNSFTMKSVAWGVYFIHETANC